MSDEEFKEHLEAYRAAGGDEFDIKLMQEIMELTKQVSRQADMIRGVMVVCDAALTLSKIANERLTALEERAEGYTMEDLVNGHQPKELGITEQHHAELQAINDSLAALSVLFQKGM